MVSLRALRLSEKQEESNKDNNTMKIIPVILLLILSINIAQAEEGVTPKLLEYDVEVIIFEDAHARYINSEDWNTDSESDTAASDTIETPQIPNKVNDTHFENIKPKILTQEHRRINNSSEYNVLFYGSWRQPGLDDKKAFEINIEELKNNHKAKSENSITGNFKLILARYLHIYGDLEYQRVSVDTTEGSVTNNELAEKAYPVKIHRRMRSKELHYIDHPLVGMLIQINPVEASEEKAATEETAEKSANP
jgi:hypothetical protein